LTMTVLIIIFCCLAGIALEKGTRTVTDVVARSPASRPYKGAAVEKGDELVAVNGTSQQCVYWVFCHAVCARCVCCVCTLLHARGTRTQHPDKTHHLELVTTSKGRPFRI
jgi:hypothetical protein